MTRTTRQSSPAFADSDLIAEAVRILRAGGVVAFPTETVYGLGADALNEAAVGRVFALKGRPAHNPLIVHIADAAGARRLVACWPPEAEVLAERYWPGPLTIVLPRSALIPDLVTGGGETVALRAPDHPLALALLRAFGGPLVGPSANPSGFISPTTAAHVREGFPAAEVLVLDGGPCAVGIESTVLSLGVGAGACVLRRGVISPEAIAGTLGRPVAVADAAPVAGGAALPGAGMLERHYAPRTPARLVEAINLEAALRDAPFGSICLTHEPARYGNARIPLLPLPATPEGYAAALYRTLREADRNECPLLLIHLPETPGPVWEAIRDRLRRATAPRGF